MASSPPEGIYISGHAEPEIPVLRRRLIAEEQRDRDAEALGKSNEKCKF